MTEQGTTINIFGQNKKTSAQGILGGATQSSGVYSLVNYSTLNSDLGTTSNTYTQAKITLANNIGVISGHGLYTLPFSTLNPDLGFTMSSGVPPTIPKTTGGGGTTKYYQMVGYYAAGATYESFVVTGSPAASSTTNPNTGHALINTYVASFWAI